MPHSQQLFDILAQRLTHRHFEQIMLPLPTYAIVIMDCSFGTNQLDLPSRYRDQKPAV